MSKFKLVVMMTVAAIFSGLLPAMVVAEFLAKGMGVDISVVYAVTFVLVPLVASVLLWKQHDCIVRWGERSKWGRFMLRHLLLCAIAAELLWGGVMAFWMWFDPVRHDRVAAFFEECRSGNTDRK